MPDAMRNLSWAGFFGALMLGGGILITETQLYAVYATDSSFLVNINFVAGVLIAGCAAVAVTLLLTGHQVGGGVASVVIGVVLASILLRSGDPRYYVPPFLDVAAGLLAILASGSTSEPSGRSALPPQ